ncbi:MAG: aminotransferase class V-fold PLP-dependent enzyme [Chloroflexi bacterium]|nr:aminotransferase class V-fold PLP-dependent enzyme [Chloroflexota bacterium]MCY4247328.1 aminotransferase class V-fold PLP-dependent enzyme [Chloroflexota bacterium]
MLTRADFLIRDDITFLNHGSFGACPKRVFAQYQAWQLRLERQPVAFLLRERVALMADACEQIAAYLNVSADDIVFVTNATSGMNIALRSLPLRAGDEILTTSHEYGAINRLLAYTAAKTGARIVRHEVKLPYASDSDFTEALFALATPRTRAIVISHITSPSALIFPIAQICQRARQQGILTIVDGAHAPGQLPLDLDSIGADIYTGNFHKWLCAPKGAGFLHARREHHAWLEPLIISHGWRDDSDFVERNEWGGTRDIAAFLTVPAAIAFLRKHDWDSVVADCHNLATQAQDRLCQRYNLESYSQGQFAQMVTIPLPPCDAAQIKARLYDEHSIEIPVGMFMGRCGLRLSVAAYNNAGDIDHLLAALGDLLG